MHAYHITEMKDRKGLEEILKEITIPIIVEGKNDKAALEKYGVRNIIEISGKPLFELATQISQQADKVLILTDFDKKGTQLAGELNLLFSSLRCLVDTKTRREIKRECVRLGKSQIETL